MNKQEIASLAFKILGIYLFVQGVNLFISGIPFLLTNLKNVDNPSFIHIILSYTTIIVLGMLLFLLANKLSLFLNKGEGDVRIDSGARIKASELQLISFTVLGLYFIGSSLPRFVSSLLLLRGTMHDTAHTIAGAASAVIQLLIGTWLLFGSRGLVIFLRKLTGIMENEDAPM